MLVITKFRMRQELIERGVLDLHETQFTWGKLT